MKPRTNSLKHRTATKYGSAKNKETAMHYTARITISRLTKPAPPSRYRKWTHPPPANSSPSSVMMLIFPPPFGRLKSARFFHHRVVGHQRVGGYVVVNGRAIEPTFVSGGGGLVECEGGEDYFHDCDSGFDQERTMRLAFVIQKFGCVSVFPSWMEGKWRGFLTGRF